MLKTFSLLATYGLCQSLPDLSTPCGHIAEVRCYDFGRHASLTRCELHAPACDHAEFLGCLQSRAATPLVIVTDAGQRHQGFHRRPYPGDAGNVHKVAVRHPMFHAKVKSAGVRDGMEALALGGTNC
jgi:hypothetical protein